MVAQGGAGVLVPEQATLAQQWHHLFDEILELARQSGITEHESVRGAGGEPRFDLVGDLLRSTDDLGTPAVHRAVQELPHGRVAVGGQRSIAGQRGLVGFGTGRECRSRAPVRPGRHR